MRSIAAPACLSLALLFHPSDDRPGELRVPLGQGAEIALVRIPATTSDEWRSRSGGLDYYVMGDGDGGYSPRRLVRLTYEFYLAKTEVTQGQWKALMDENPSAHPTERREGRDACPVDSISWIQAYEFIRRLSERTAAPIEGYVYRLPTEAEWEYASRAGRQTVSEEELRDTAWWNDSSREPMPVGQKEPNAWGLHDMLGNVFEWVHDYWPTREDVRRGDEGTIRADPVGHGGQCNMRGGAWYSDEHVRTFGWRAGSDTLDRRGANHVGFRLALGPPVTRLEKAPDPPPTPSRRLISTKRRRLVRVRSKPDEGGSSIEKAYVTREYNDAIHVRVCYDHRGREATGLSAYTYAGGANTGKWGYRPMDVMPGRHCGTTEIGMSSLFDYSSDEIVLEAGAAEAAFRFAKRWREDPDRPTEPPYGTDPRVEAALVTLARAASPPATPSPPATRWLLFELARRDSAMASSNDPLARLFTEGDERLADLIHFLDDPLPEVRASAQKALRYLANPEGMAAVRARLEKAPNESLAAPVPVPLRPADYARIDGEIVGKPLRAPGWGTAVPYLYALALDDAPEAARILDTIAQTGDGNAVSGSTFTAKALCAARLLRPGELVAEKDERLEDLVARHAFFLQPCPPGGAGAPGFRAYARLVAMTADGRRALLVVGWQAAPLAGEWYHVVVRKTERGWRFVSVTLAAVS